MAPILPPKVCATCHTAYAEPFKLYCAACAAARNKRNEERHAAAKAFYKSVAWQRIRAARLRREPLCRMCAAAGKITPANEVDHIDGDYRHNWPANHQSLCKPCHARKTMREQGALSNGGVGA